METYSNQIDFTGLIIKSAITVKLRTNTILLISLALVSISSCNVAKDINTPGYRGRSIVNYPYDIETVTYAISRSIQTKGRSITSQNIGETEGEILVRYPFSVSRNVYGGIITIRLKNSANGSTVEYFMPIQDQFRQVYLRNMVKEVAAVVFSPEIKEYYDNKRQTNKEQKFKNVDPPSAQNNTTIVSTDNVNIPKLSDIDKDIPELNSVYLNKFALIIGNEDYDSYQSGLRIEENVDYAVRDASIFREYAISVLGVPEDNIIFLLNGKAIEMNRAVEKLTLIIKVMDGQADIIFYYAGHGFYEETTKEPCIIPVDVTSADLAYSLKLKDVYHKLTEHSSKRVTVFLDACFSGGGRNQGLLASRGIKIKPNNSLLKGNLVVFSAASEAQDAFALDEQRHGVFTYYLLKKMKESKGNITYKELADYLKQKVSITSAMSKAKEQIPEVKFSYDVRETWESWTLGQEIDKH